MVLPVFFIANMGRIIPVVVGIGTALFGFVAKNPKIIGTTLSLEAISSAILSYTATEKISMSKSDIFVLCEWLQITVFIFLARCI